MSVEKLKKLKENFQKLEASEKQLLKESLHKFHLGVEEESDSKRVLSFFSEANFKMEFKKETLAEILDFLTNDTQPSPQEFITAEESITKASEAVQTCEETVDDLPRFDQDADEIETLKNNVKPLK